MNKKLIILISSILILLLAIVSIILFYTTINAFLVKNWQNIVFMTGVFVSIFFVLTFHELGHLCMGLYQGFRLELFVTGFLGIKREPDGKIKVYFNKDLNYFGGVAATCPVTDSPDNFRKFGLVIISGPLASVLLTCICFVLAPLFIDPWQFLLVVTGVTSFMIFLATTLPNKAGIFFTDRKRFQRLLQKGKTQEIEMALIRTIAIASRDESLKKASLQDFELIKSDNDRFIKFMGSYYLLYYYLETGSPLAVKEMTEYTELSKKIPANLVKLLGKELEKARLIGDN